MKKRFFTLMMLLTAIAMSTWAQEPYAVLSDDYTVLTFYYDYNKASRNGMSVGPYTYNGSGNPCTEWNTWDKNNKIVKVVFDKSFDNCHSITSTSCWFCDIYNLKTIEGLEYLHTENVTDMSHMFERTRLTNLDLRTFDTSKVTDMTRFVAYSELKSVNLSSFNTANVTTMYEMFEQCNYLTSLDLSNFNTEKVTNMSDMFNSCSKLTDLNISSFNTANVTDMSWMFSSCRSLTSLDLTHFNTAKVTDMSSMFGNCSSLKSLNLSSFNTEKVTDMSYMFSAMKESDANQIKALDLSSFNTKNVEDMSFMFAKCCNLKAIYVDEEGWSTAKVTGDEEGDWMFFDCTSLVGGNGTTYDENHVDKLYARVDKPGQPGYLSTTPLERYAALSEDNSVLTFYYDRKKGKRNGMSIHPFTLSIDSRVDSGWDSYREQIKKVTFDISFNAEYEQVTSTALWFYGFSNLETVENLNYLITLNVEDMNHMFAGCRSLKSLNVDNLVWNRAKDLSYLFYNCESLTSLDLRTWCVKDLSGRYEMTNLSHMFDGCRSLTSLDLSLLDTWKVTDMSFMFANCESLTNLRFIQNNQLFFDTNEVTDMSYMFANCKKLKDLDVNVFKTQNLENMDGMFMLCENMKTIDISGLQTSGVTSMKNMFNSCYNLKTIYVTLYWNTSNVTESTDMFKDSEKLVGGAGTKYNASYTDKEYARIDKPGQPGYLTDKNATGIESLTTDPSSKSNESYYTLDGRVLNGEPVQKGVYIFNGKKVIR